MPRTLPFAGALLALGLPLLGGARVARAETADASPVAAAAAEAPSTVAFQPSLYLGAIGGHDNFFGVLGLDGTLAIRHLRLTAFGEVGGGVFGPQVGTLGGAVGIGTLPGSRFEATLGVEAGVHHYSGLGNDLFSQTVRGGTADLPFAGLRAAATWYFGKERHFGLGVVGFARTDLTQRSVPTTTYGGFVEYGTSHTLEHAGWSNSGAAVRLVASF